MMWMNDIESEKNARAKSKDMQQQVETYWKINLSGPLISKATENNGRCKQNDKKNENNNNSITGAYQSIGAVGASEQIFVWESFFFKLSRQTRLVAINYMHIYSLL